jgi:hypothetical protein
MRDEWIRSVVLIIFVGMTSSVLPVRAQQFSPWSAPVNLNAVKLSDGTVCPAVVNSASDDSHPAISKDGLSLYFSSNRPGGLGDFDLWVVKRDSMDDCWKVETLRNLGPVVNTSAEDVAPNLSTDGHWLFFHSKRGGGCYSGTVRELWVTHRRDADEDFGEFGWEAPTNLGCAMDNGFGINQANADNAGPAPFEDQFGNLFLYFTRSLTPNNAALADIYVSTCAADLGTCNTLGGWGTGNKVDSLSSPFRDTRMAIRRRDGLEMIFSTGRPGSLGSENLWDSTRATTMDDWLPPVPINCEWKDNVSAIQNSLVPPVSCPPWAPLDPPGTPPTATAFVNSNFFDGAPALSWDGTELYFFSERTDLTGFAGGRDLYVSKRTKLPD